MAIGVILNNPSEHLKTLDKKGIFVYNADKLFYACFQHYPYSRDKHGKTNRIESYTRK